jgi:DNA primase
MIPESIVDEVRARADVVDVIGEHIPLKRAGREFRALCPFHHEKTPSFYVVPAKGFYKCFGCGEAGDVFTFLMKRQGLNFQEAVKQIAARVGVEIPESSGPPREDPHKHLHEAVAFAADFYQQQMWGEASGARARAYLDSRDISHDAAHKFLLGYAPDDWRSLREAAIRAGIPDEVLLEAGLVKVSEHGERDPYDRLRDRLVFPILDVGGRLVGFGGRVLGKATEGVPKYLNSPETPIYHKGQMLYGLNWSRGAIRKEGSALVVEGNMDYVSLAARGIENVVAGLGTSITPEQAALLSRYTARALLLYDRDQAGLRASFKTGDALLRARVHPLVVTLPPGEDPDSVVRKGGPEALTPLLNAATDVLEKKLQILEERGYFEHIEGTRHTLDRLLPTLRAAADPALRDIYVSRVEQRTGVRRETLERELGGTFRPAPAAPPPREPSGRGVVRNEQWTSERHLLKLLLLDEGRIAQAMQILEPNDFRDPLHQQIYEALASREVEAEGQEDRKPELRLSGAAAERLAALKTDPLEITDGDRNFEDALHGMRFNGLLLSLDDIDRRIGHADPAEQEDLLREKSSIKQQIGEMNSSGRLGYKASLRWKQKLSKTDRPGA